GAELDGQQASFLGRGRKHRGTFLTWGPHQPEASARACSYLTRARSYLAYASGWYLGVREVFCLLTLRFGRTGYEQAGGQVVGVHRGGVFDVGPVLRAPLPGGGRLLRRQEVDGDAVQGRLGGAVEEQGGPLLHGRLTRRRRVGFRLMSV